MSIRMTGALYAEALVAVAILALAMVPATNAIHAALQSSQQFVTNTTDHFSVMGRMAELSAEPYASLDAAATTAGSWKVATSYSDGSGPSRRLVYLSLYDIDNADGDDNPFTGTEPDVIWIRVEIEGSIRGLETLITQ
jgi:hypothetical protein